MQDIIAADVSHEELDLPATPVEPVNALTLLARAVERGMDPSQLKALVDLHEQMKAARAKEAFNLAMNAVQTEMPVIVRDAQNSHTQSSYIRLETLTHRAKPIYVAHGFSLSFSEQEAKAPNLRRHTCHIRHNEGHSEQHWIDLPVDGTGAKGGKSAMNEVQAAISTGSYAQRVLTCRVFNITIADTDLDGQGGRNDPYDNPSPNPTAPTAPPRSGAPISRDQCAALYAYWQQKYPTEGKSEYELWVRGVARRGFAVFKSHEWTPNDYHACCRALNFDPEAAQ